MAGRQKKTWLAFGRRLKAARERAGLSQAQLALAAGMPRGTLQNWEQGRTSADLHRAADVAEVLGVSLDELAGIGVDKAARRGK